MILDFSAIALRVLWERARLLAPVFVTVWVGQFSTGWVPSVRLNRSASSIPTRITELENLQSGARSMQQAILPITGSVPNVWFGAWRAGEAL